ncbi:glycosyltransferase family 2 protein [Pseudotamlana carrageenivorans]|uniref:Glycosyltransferase family 2 protein n=1 Tax=Pseudotamlana carrageenivorans TaxID=2069432 RepID=A0A2I7SDZ2_9FLAO|nr:glycosyltransferase [Tamlana carrageenivorans]AUS04119.1 glycosyltransferase family 2 protein [Tamlana carrageenivorans]
MIVLTHNNHHVLRVEDISTNTDIVFQATDTILNVMYNLAEQFPNHILVWQHASAVSYVDFDYIAKIPALDRKCLSYCSQSFFPDAIGYVEQSPFLNIKKEVCYPTWQMSGLVGVIKTSNLLQFKNEVNSTNFSYALNAIAKLGMPQGLWCYSEPSLLKQDLPSHEKQASTNLLFKFVKQHYKWVWVWLLFLNKWIYERTISLYALCHTFTAKRTQVSFKPQSISIKKRNQEGDGPSTIDVIIPTIGRPDYLYDVLSDLRNQSHLPKRIIIVEQNPEPESVSDLHYLRSEIWPFEIDHTFTHQTGACFARNLALSKVQSEWVFLNDDDNRFAPNLLAEVLQCANQYGVEAILTSYLQPNEELFYKKVHQTSIFGSGNSFVKSKYLHKVAFDMSLEFGYGEDTDFGMQLRNIGVDVIYFPNLCITHLKAPRGGFRSTFVQPWEHEKIQPKPSPTIMYLKQKYYTIHQIQGYQLLLFFKMHKLNIFKVRSFLKRWKQSEKWAELLSEKSQNGHA